MTIVAAAQPGRIVPERCAGKGHKIKRPDWKKTGYRMPCGCPLTSRLARKDAGIQDAHANAILRAERKAAQ